MLSFLLRWAFAAMSQPVPLGQLYDCLTLFAGGHNHDGHTILGVWIITGMLSFLLRWAFAAMLQPVPLGQLYYCLTLFAGGHNHDGHTKLGLWIITGMLSFLIIEKIFAKEGEFEHVSTFKQ